MIIMYYLFYKAQTNIHELNSIKSWALPVVGTQLKKGKREASLKN